MNGNLRMLALSAGFVGAMVAEGALPEAKITSFTQNESSRQVKIIYNLSSDAIVTLDIETNVTEEVFASIGEENVIGAVGAVNRLVKAGEDLEITWRPDRSWPGHVYRNGEVRAALKVWAMEAPPDYMVIDLDSKSVAYYPCAKALPFGGVSNDIYRTSKIAFRKIPAAGENFMMTASKEVQLSKDFYMAIFEMTKGQAHRIGADTNKAIVNGYEQNDMTPFNDWAFWQIRCGSQDGPSGTVGFQWPNEDLRTARSASSSSLIGHLRSLFDGKYCFDLPTEAQWFYARGTQTDEMKCFAGSLQRVGTRKPNEFGIYDMVGNARECCLDIYSAALSGTGAVEIDPPGPSSYANSSVYYHILRGGAYNDSGDIRQLQDPWSIKGGVRLCLTLGEELRE